MQCMAKLARLMLSDPSLLIEPAKLAASSESLSGEFSLSDMPRIQGLVLNLDQAVAYRLRFDKNAEGTITIAGIISATVVVLCQRCLNEMRLTAENQVNVGLIGKQSQGVVLPDDVEPYQADDREISLLQLIEEELLLGLPLSPMHKPDECPARIVSQGEVRGKESPFAVLRQMKTDKNR